MARSAVLNIIFGAETGQLDRALGGVQKRLRRTAGEFQRLGDSMSRSVSLPIIGLGAAAVKSASDLETLETSFISLAGGANEAAQLVNQLNEFTAKTPFQLEAVGNAARQLIAAGTGVDEVNQQLQFLGDIAATSGSSIDEIAAIFSKVQAKGKVELESLNQLAERGIPIFTALSEATGLPADKLGAGAVSVEQFNNTLASFAEEGGFAAGAMERLSETTAGKFSTAMDNLKLAAAEIGEVLLPVINRILEGTISLAQKFGGLSSGVKTAIVVIGGLAAAMGPLFIAIGSVIGAYANLNLALTGFKARQLATAAATAADTSAKVTNSIATKAATAVQRKLNLALLANPYLIAAAAAAALGFALYNAQKDVTVMQDRVDDLSTAIYNVDTTSAVKQIKNLREEINATAQEAAADQAWVESLKIQAGTLGFVIDAFTNYEKQLEDTAKASADLAKQEEKFNSDRKFAAEADERLAALAAEREKKRAAEAERQRIAALPTLEELRKKAKETQKQIADLQEDAQLGIRVDTTQIEDLQKELKDTTAQIELMGASIEANPISGLFKDLEATAVPPQVSDLFTQLEDVEVGPSVSDLLGDLGQMSFENMMAGAEDVPASFKDILTNAETLQQLGGELGNSFQSAFASITSGAASPAEAMKSLALGVIDSAIAAASAAAIQAAAQGSLASGPLAPVVLPALIGAMTGLVRGALNSIPALATGGLTTGPTLAMVGDNASGKEAIIPFERMGEFMKMAGGGQSQQVVVTGRISGKDIVLSNQRGSRDRSRVK